MNIPDISRAEVDARRNAELVETMLTATAEQGVFRDRLARGSIPAPPAPSRNTQGESYFTFGNSIEDGVPLAPSK